MKRVYVGGRGNLIHERCIDGASVAHTALHLVGIFSLLNLAWRIQKCFHCRGSVVLAHAKWVDRSLFQARFSQHCDLQMRFFLYSDVPSGGVQASIGGFRHFARPSFAFASHRGGFGHCE